MIYRLHHGPAASAFLSSLVHDEVDDVLARLWINLLEDIRGDFNEKALQIASVPISKDISEFLIRKSRGLKDIVSLTNELHVAILDAIVNHFNKMAGAAFSDVNNTRLSVDFSRNSFKDRLHDFPGALWTTRHDGWAFERAFLAS